MQTTSDTPLRSFVKRSFPRLWRVLATSRAKVVPVARDARYRMRYAELVSRRVVKGGSFRRGDTGTAVVNAAPNSGALTSADQGRSLDEIQTEYAQRSHRSFLGGAFRGYALNDALRWDEPQMYYSFSGLALSSAKCAERLLGVAPSELRVLELGCGAGSLGDLFFRLGVADYVGIDGNALAGAHSPFIRDRREHFLFLNLQEEIRLQRGGAPVLFDVVCSFEVLEHIDEAAIATFLSNVKAHLRPGGLFICSASLNRDQDVHVTVHERDWWLRAFSQAGFREVPGSWDMKVSRNHPWNWHPEQSNVFVLAIPE